MSRRKTLSVLVAEERDEYDDEFDRMREANLKTRVVQAQEELKDASKRVDDCRLKLSHARAQARTPTLHLLQQLTVALQPIIHCYLIFAGDALAPKSRSAVHRATKELSEPAGAGRSRNGDGVYSHW